MQLHDFLDFESIRVGLSGGNKRKLLQQLGQMAGARLGFDPAAIVDTISERERLGSTGFGNGVAIPHGKVEGLKRIYAMVVRLAEPVDYKAIDGQPVDLVFLLLSPPDAGAEHLKALAAVSRVIRHGPTLEKLRGARSRDAGMCGDAVVYRDDQLRALHEQVVDQRRTQPVTVSRAVRHAIVDVARTEQAQPAHGDGSAGCPVAIEVADDDDALFRPDRILEDLARAPDAADRRRQQCGEAVVQLRGTRDSARGIDSLEHGMSIRAGREIRRQFAPFDARLLHAGSAAATRRQNRQRCIRR